MKALQVISSEDTAGNHSIKWGGGELFFQLLLWRLTREGRG